jgi:hypothetical protein
MTAAERYSLRIFRLKNFPFQDEYGKSLNENNLGGWIQEKPS